MMSPTSSGFLSNFKANKESEVPNDWRISVIEHAPAATTTTQSDVLETGGGGGTRPTDRLRNARGPALAIGGTIPSQPSVGAEQVMSPTNYQHQTMGTLQGVTKP